MINTKMVKIQRKIQKIYKKKNTANKQIFKRKTSLILFKPYNVICVVQILISDFYLNVLMK